MTTKTDISPESVEHLAQKLEQAFREVSGGRLASIEATTLRAQSARIAELENEVDAEILARDGFEAAFSAAYEAATGREMDWSNVFGINEALQEIGEASAQVRAEALREAAECVGHITQSEDRDAILALIEKEG